MNDEADALPRLHNGIRAGYEQLLRRLMGYPKRPGVIIYNGFRWTRNNHPDYPAGASWAEWAKWAEWAVWAPT